MPRQIREILASVRETGDRGRNTGAPGKYGRSGNPSGTTAASINFTENSFTQVGGSFSGVGNICDILGCGRYCRNRFAAEAAATRQI